MARLLRFYASVTLIALAATQAHAEPRDLNSRIEAVTVFPDGAVVTRGADVTLTAGPSVLAFKYLPNDLDPASLRVTGVADADMAIGSVATQLVPAETKPNTAIEAQLRDLRTQRDGVTVTLDALEAKKSMALRFAKADPEDLGNGEKSLSVSEWPAAFDAIAAALLKTGEDLRVATAKAQELDAAIAALMRAGAQTNGKLELRRTVEVEINAAAAAKGHVTLTYRVAHAGWHPVYDARLDTGNASNKPSLELVRRATVTQRSGEDWDNVVLTVSTVRASRNTTAPAMETRKLVFQEPIPVAAAPAQTFQFAPEDHEPDFARKRAERKTALPAPPVPQPPPPTKAATETASQLDAGDFQASFVIPDRINLAADATAKTFAISSRHINPEIAIKSVPALDAAAYLEGHFVNEEEAPLLPGDVALYRNGSYVGHGSLGLVATGDALDLGFGVDERVKITRVPVKRRENEPNWFGQTKTETREFKTTVKNLHEFPVKIVVVDQIPISENTAIVVEQLPTTTTPTEKTVADKRGVMSWTYDYTPGQTRELRLAYRMKWPGDREVTSEIAR